MSKRLCGITITCDSHVILLLCVYFPTDPGTQTFDETNLDVVLSDIRGMCESVCPDSVIIGGDINCDFNRNSGFVNKVRHFTVQNDLCIVWDKFPVDFTYIHTDKDSSSTIDHFCV